MTPLRLLLLTLLLRSLTAKPVPPASASAARLLLRAPQPVSTFTSWLGTLPTWYSGMGSSTSASVPLSGRTAVCPVDYPMGFTVVCDPGDAAAHRAVFQVRGRTVKVASRSWYGPYQVEGYFRGANVVWEGFASGRTLACKLGDGRAVQATIDVSC